MSASLPARRQRSAQRQHSRGSPTGAGAALSGAAGAAVPGAGAWAVQAADVQPPKWHAGACHLHASGGQPQGGGRHSKTGCSAAPQEGHHRSVLVMWPVCKATALPVLSGSMQLTCHELCEEHRLHHMSWGIAVLAMQPHEALSALQVPFWCCMCACCSSSALRASC